MLDERLLLLLFQRYTEGMPEMSRDQDLEKELEKHERRRHRMKWKGGAQRVAGKLASAIKKHGDSMNHHSESEAPSLPESRFPSAICEGHNLCLRSSFSVNHGVESFDGFFSF